MQGNPATVDARGFVEASAGMYEGSSSKGHVVTRVLEHPALRGPAEAWVDASYGRAQRGVCVGGRGHVGGQAPRMHACASYNMI